MAETPNRRRRGLGKGLEALIPTPPPSGVMEIEVEKIKPNPSQPRVGLKALEELADSIRENGVVQPIIVTRTEEGFQIIAGERRWRAAQMAGLATVPAIIREADPPDRLALALVENLQREDLNPLEAASAYQELIENFGLTQEEIARRVGKDRSTVANTLRLLRLPEVAKGALLSNLISEGHARALLRLESRLQKRALEAILNRNLNVRQTEELVRRLIEGPPQLVSKAPEDLALEEAFRRALGTKVTLARSKKGGRVIIHFYSEEELQGLYDLLVE
jgi:ParB family chromosome partitioning protein